MTPLREREREGSRIDRLPSPEPAQVEASLLDRIRAFYKLGPPAA